MTNTAEQTLDSNKKSSKHVGTWYSLVYDVIMLIVISIDLLFILIDNLLMSDALTNFSNYLAYEFNFIFLSKVVANYGGYGYGYFNHTYLSMLGGFFTLFLIGELLARWLIAIIFKHYYRWFFFPFVHWYEVLGCFPQLRVLRLLRVIAIGRRLYQMGYRFLPEKWLESLKFYYNVLLEELSDKVLLTATNNIRSQLNESVDSQILVKKTIDKNRENIKAMLLSLLRTELAPRLRAELMPTNQNSPVATHVGLAIADAVEKTPEIELVLAKIPIAGNMIKSQILAISEKVGYNIAESVSNRLLQDEVLDEIFVSIADGISQINPNNPALEALIADIIEEGLTAFEQQIKIQQWRHKEKIDSLPL
ncbi:MAG: hypothetical protein KGV51_08650 [Moraxellaceae bacterium]|nr:hypothetical protein [Moraxellaceae bacterium]